MRAVVQRVNRANVQVNGQLVSEIGSGLVILLGVPRGENQSNSEWLVSKILNMRIFGDEMGVMNRSILEMQGEILVVSQFTLMARTHKGNRPSYVDAAPPQEAELFYEAFVDALKAASGLKVVKGIFGADMQLELVNSGPVTIIVDTFKKE